MVVVGLLVAKVGCQPIGAAAMCVGNWGIRVSLRVFGLGLVKGDYIGLVNGFEIVGFGLDPNG